MRSTPNHLIAGCAFVALTTLCGVGCPGPRHTVNVVPPRASVMEGVTLPLSAASTDRDDAFEWSTSDRRIARVDSSGVVFGVAEGTTTITAYGSHSGESGSCTVEVKEPNDLNLSLPTDPASVEPSLDAQSSVDACTCTIQLPGIAARVERVNSIRYHRLQLPGAAATGEVGKAALPYYALHFGIPLEAQGNEPADWNVNVTVGQEVAYDEVRPYPAQPPAWLGEASRPEFTLDETFYASVGPYPGYTHETDTFQMGNLHVLEVRVYPAQYYPLERLLVLATHLDVDVRFSSAKADGLRAPVVLGDFTGVQESRHEEWIAGTMLNHEIIIPLGQTALMSELPELDVASLQDDPFELLIVTRPELYSQAFRLGRYRQGQGTRVRLLSLDWGAYATWESIRDLVLTLDNANRLPMTGGHEPHALTDIVILGDAEVIPTGLGMNERDNPDPASAGDDPVAKVGTDLFYSTLRGGDDRPDVNIGRISVDDATQAGFVIDKIEDYEARSLAFPPQRMAAYSYFDDVVRPAGVVSGTVSPVNGSTEVTGTGTRFVGQLFPGDWVRLYDPGNPSGWSGQVDVVVTNRWLKLRLPWPGPTTDWPSGLEVGVQDGRDDWEFVKMTERVRQFMHGRGVEVRFGYTRNIGPSPTFAFNGTLLPLDLLSYAWDANRVEIWNNWIEGVDGIILHCAHGEPEGWVFPEFDVDWLAPMTAPDTAVYPILFSINCESGYFDNETDQEVIFGGAVQDRTSSGVGRESFCEVALRFEDGGSVASVGSCRGSDAAKNDKLVDGLFGALYEDYEAGSIPVGPGTRPTFTRLGGAVRAAKFHMYWHTSYRPHAEYNMQAYHLIGDPLLRLNVPEPAGP